MPSFDLNDCPFVEARHFKRMQGPRPVRLIVIHSMEAPEKGDTAENVAQFFHATEREASAHLCVDNNSVVRCVRDDDIAFAAPGANADGVHLELAGFARQTEPEWLDAFGVLMLDGAANLAAQYSVKYGIPVKRLSNAELADKTSKGLVSHAQVSEVFKKSDHTDPGNGFPWAFFLERIAIHRAALQPTPTAIAAPAREMRSARSSVVPTNVKTVQLSGGAGPPSVEIEIGQMQFGRYELSLFDTDGRNPVVFGQGLGHDQLPDTFQIDGDPRALNARFVSWSVNLLPAGSEVNPQFSVTVHFRQNGREATGSPIASRGPLPGPRVEFDFVKLEVV